MNDQLIKIVAEGSEKGIEIKANLGKMIMNSFFSGLAWGLGTVIGATVIVALLVFIASKLNTAPIVGDYISEIIKQIQNASLNQ